MHEDPELTELGSCRINIFLNNIHGDKVIPLMDKFADALKDAGFAISSDDEQVNALLTLEQWLWPEDDGTFMEEVAARAIVVMVPSSDPNLDVMIRPRLAKD